MSRWSARWRATSAPDRFRLYTRATLQFVLLALVVSQTIFLSAAGHGIAPVAGLLIAGLAAAALIEARPGIGTTARWVSRRQWVIAATVALVAIWAGALVAAAVTDGSADTVAGTLATYGAFLISLAVLPFVRWRWHLAVALAFLTAAGVGDSWTSRLVLFATVLGITLFFLGTMLLTLWSLRVVEDLERSKDLHAQLTIAQERLRFSRDLHDVVGRSFSAIAVKSELAATLSRSGAAERAQAEMEEVKSLAVSSMEETRSLVRGYRDIDLPGEVAGARSLLSSAGCTLRVDGSPERVPPAYHDAAAWVVREGTTNIVRQSSASDAEIAFGPAGMSLRNNGVSESPGERSGLVGLQGRLASVGARLDTAHSDDTFTLVVHWDRG